MNKEQDVIGTDHYELCQNMHIEIGDNMSVSTFFEGHFIKIFEGIHPLKGL